MQPGTLARSDTQFISGAASVRRSGSAKHLFNLLLATAFFQCWQYILGFSLWATAIVLIQKFGKVDISIQPTLLTVLGTVLGFVISYRTSSSFERYNEGRRYWSTIIYNSRTFARTVWFHVPDIAVVVGETEDEKRARTLVEKKTVLNLTEAFAVAVKHYLRGEEGITYVDLYHLTKYLPAYALPAGLPTNPHEFNQGYYMDESAANTYGPSTGNSTLNAQGLPMPATSPIAPSFRSKNKRGAKGSTHPNGEPVLLPARNPPPFGIFDIFPLTLLVKPLLNHGFDIGGKLAQKTRAKMPGGRDTGRGTAGAVVSHNVPLEITLYMSAYVSALQQRKVCDVPTINLMLNSLNALVDSLTGLERILTTPIPFSFSVHLWTVTLVYCAALPFQIVKSLDWITIPGTAIAAFIFTGFIVAGEEIENPFGFDRNDLNLDHFTHNIIRAEMASITAVPVPDPKDWCFRPDNNSLFSNDGKQKTLEPELWVKKGEKGIRSQLAKATHEALELDEKNDKKKKSKDHGEPPQAEHPVGNSAHAIGVGGAAGGAAGDASSPVGE